MLYYDRLVNNHPGFMKELSGIPFISVSFAQFGEDVVLRSIIEDYFPAFLRKKANSGYFVDLGAFNPVVYSNTFALYLLGWRGLNVDASFSCIESCNNQRPRDTNICIGVSDKDETLTYNVFEKHFARNTFDPNMVEQTLSKGIPVARTESIECMNVNKLLDTYKKSHVDIHYLSIDLEGFDERIVLALDWQRFKPWVVSVEVHAPTLQASLETPIAKHLIQNGYSCVSKCHLTMFFVLNTFIKDTP